MFQNLSLLNLHRTLKVFKLFFSKPYSFLFKQDPSVIQHQVEQIRAGHLELGNSKASLYQPSAAKLSEAHRQRGDCSESIHPDWISEAIYKIKEFPEILNFLQLYSWVYTFKCVHRHIHVCVYMCLFIFNFYFFLFCVYIPHQACDADPDKYDSIDFYWAKEGYVRWESLV